MRTHLVKTSISDWLFFTFIFVLLAGILCSCSTTTPREIKLGEKTFIQMDKKFMGITVSTETKEVEKKKTQKQKTEERQSAAAFWFGSILLGFAPICVIIGYVVKGWKFWGILAALCGLLGAAFWSFENLVPFLRWGAYGVVAAVALWTMWKVKNFSLFERKTKTTTTYTNTFTN